MAKAESKVEASKSVVTIAEGLKVDKDILAAVEKVALEKNFTSVQVVAVSANAVVFEANGQPFKIYHGATA
jgi:hypothetical protein